MKVERALLRAQVIVDEAGGRHIANQGMLRQLNMLADVMYRGFYVLDTVRHPAHGEDTAGSGHQVPISSHSWALSTFNYAKRVCASSSCSSNAQTLQELEDVHGDLKNLLVDVTELLMLLTTYPRLHRQPYAMHLLLDNCLFGRQREMELVINFLLHTQPPCSAGGKLEVRKSSLVAHICEDERVRGHFSRILLFRHGHFRDEDVAISRDVVGHEEHDHRNNNGRLLAVLEVAGDLDQELWERLRSRCAETEPGSKVIITSRSDEIAKLGTTTHALTLKHLHREAYWYFFKVITFGSTDPELAHPRFMRLAMEIAETLDGNLMSANITARLLRSNFSVHVWCRVLNFLRGYVEKHLSRCGEHPNDLLKYPMGPTYFGRMQRPAEDILVLDQYQTCSSPEEEIPKITLIDLVYGNIRPHGTFEMLFWRSRIPPYHCYIYTCEIRGVQTRLVKKKRSRAG